MSNILEPWLLGKNVTVKMTPQDIAAGTGVMSDNAAGTFVFNGRLEEHDEMLQLETDNISPTDCPYPNGVIIEQGYRLTIREIASQLAKQSSSGSLTSGNKLRQALLISYYHKVVIEEFDNANVLRSGTTGRLSTCTMYLRLATFGKNVPKAKAIYAADFEVHPVSDGAGGYIANPAYSNIT